MHIPVLQDEVIRYLDPRPRKNFIDATYGFGGHGAAILKANGPDGKVLGIEIDKQLYTEVMAAKLKIKNAAEGEPRQGREKLKNRLLLINDSFTNIKRIAEENDFFPVHGILFDLGFSAWHIESSGRGFSFQKDEPLDMRYNPKFASKSAADIINSWSVNDLADVFREYGEERFARRIAKRIYEERRKERIRTTKQLSKIIISSLPGYSLRYIHPATKVFQALRIAVNNELDNIEKALPQAFEILARDGRLVVISFHSLEDRIVKQFFRRLRQEGKATILTKKPVRPTESETEQNPRARSARLRAIRKA